MKFSIAKEKITPEFPVYQGGFAARNHKSTGVHDDAYASVVLIRANKTAVLIALDLLMGDRSFEYGIKEAIVEKFGFARDQIIINYSHTHSVVAVTGENAEKRNGFAYSIAAGGYLWDKEKSEVDYSEDLKYYDFVKSRILDMLSRGLENLTEGEAYILKGRSKFGVSRRLPSGKGVLWKPNYDENSIDTDLFMIKLLEKSKKISGLLYNYACHATTLGPDNYLISSDFPGVVRRTLEKSNPGMLPVFLQGCGADIKPYITADHDRFKSCSFAELEQGGASLAREIQACLNTGEWRRIEFSDGIETGCSEVKLYTEVWDAAKWEAIFGSKEEEYLKKSARVMLGRIRNHRTAPDNYLPYSISFLRLDKRTCFVCLEDEVASDTGKKIKRLFDEDIVVLGYSNSCTCYIPSRRMISEGGYESESFIPARLAGPFVPEIEDIIIGSAAVMVKGADFGSQEPPVAAVNHS